MATVISINVHASKHQISDLYLFENARCIKSISKEIIKHIISLDD